MNQIKVLIKIRKYFELNDNKIQITWIQLKECLKGNDSFILKKKKNWTLIGKHLSQNIRKKVWNGSKNSLSLINLRDKSTT